MPLKRKHYAGRQGSGHGQRQIITEDYSLACSLYGKNFIDRHLDAKARGITKLTLRDLIIIKEKKNKTKK